MDALNIRTIGSICNSLNAKEGQYRHLKAKTQQDKDMEFYLNSAQDVIWSLWGALKEEGKIKTCNICGLDYYDGDTCPVAKSHPKHMI